MTIYLSLSHWRYNHHPHRDRYNILLSLRRRRDTSPNLNLNPRIPKHLQTRISKQSHPALHKGQQALKYNYISSRLREDILKHGSSVTKVWAPTIHHTLDIIRSATFVSAPRQILFHVGTNDLDTCETEEIRENFCVLFQETSGIVPATQLYVSDILPREGMENKVLHANVLLLCI